MKSIPFSKFSGCGNDFILIDNRDGLIPTEGLPHFATNVCRRRMSAGADGLILIENAENADFRWQFLNSDGSRADMCGNGARCAARFARQNSIAGKQMSFQTEAGIVKAEVDGDNVRIGMTDPSDLRLEIALVLNDEPILVSSIHTGVPHVVVPVEDRRALDAIDVVTRGKSIRFHEAFAPDGANANFCCLIGDNRIAARTYERGVEDETLACGTGAVAGAIVMGQTAGLTSPTSVQTQGGWLTIHYGQTDDGYTDVWLEGDAREIYSGVLLEDAWQY